METLSYKTYSATGNTFVIFDLRQNEALLDSISSSQWEKLCEKEKVDGLLFLAQGPQETDFRMIYLNRDGGEVSMCGNGLRALGVFAHTYGQVPLKENYRVKTKNATYLMNPNGNPRVLMTERYDQAKVEIQDLFHAKTSFYINTGVPHCIYLVDDVDALDLMKIAPPIRYDARFSEGVNVNFVQKTSAQSFKIRTYERGVEAETLSCGTGMIAASYFLNQEGMSFPFQVISKGGELSVCEGEGGLWLEGAVTETGSGTFSF